MKRWAWCGALFLLTWSAGSIASPAAMAPGRAAGPGAEVTLVATDVPLETVLARLNDSVGAKLAWDAPVGHVRVTVGVHACPLSDAIAALAAVTGADWEQLGEGQLHLRSPSISPAVVDTRALIARLTATSPPWMRSRPDGPHADARRRSAPVDIIYGSLRGAALDTLEEGGEVAFAQLPARAQAALTDYVRQSAAAQMRAALQPAWVGVPAEHLGLGLSKSGTSGRGATWALMARSPGGLWRPLAKIPYQPVPSPPVRVPASRGPRTVADRALGVAERTGIGVVIGEAGDLLAAQPAGATAQDLLESLLPEGGIASCFRCSWKRVGTVYWLEFGPAGERPEETPERTRYRRLLAAAVPGEYRTLITMESRQRSLALGALWAKLWQSLSPEQQTAEQPLPVSELTGAQRAQLVAALQAQMVERVSSILEGPLSDDLRRGSVSLDFEMGAYAGGGTLGVPRVLRVRQGERVLLMDEVNEAPLLLHLLPSGNVVLQKRVDLAFREEPLHTVVARVSEALNAPVVVEEPQQEVRLTGEFHRRPLLLVLHWIERRAGLVWCKAGGAYVLAAPISIEALAREPGQVVSALGRDVPKPVAAGSRSGVAEAVTDQDRAALQTGVARFSDLSAPLRSAIEKLLASDALLSLDAVQSSWETLNRLGEAHIKLTTTPATVGDGQRFLQITVSGLHPIALPVPTQGPSR